MKGIWGPVDEAKLCICQARTCAGEGQHMDRISKPEWWAQKGKMEWGEKEAERKWTPLSVSPPSPASFDTDHEPRLERPGKVLMCLSWILSRTLALKRWKGYWNNIAAKRVEDRCCALFHPRSNLWTTWFVARQIWMRILKRATSLFSSFAAMLQNNLHLFVARFL